MISGGEIFECFHMHASVNAIMCHMKCACLNVCVLWYECMYLFKNQYDGCLGLRFTVLKLFCRQTHCRVRKVQEWRNVGVWVFVSVSELLQNKVSMCELLFVVQTECVSSDCATGIVFQHLSRRPRPLTVHHPSLHTNRQEAPMTMKSQFFCLLLVCCTKMNIVLYSQTKVFDIR